MSAHPFIEILGRGFGKAAEYAPIMNEYPKMSALIIGSLSYPATHACLWILSKIAPKLYYNANISKIERAVGYGLLLAEALYIALDYSVLTEHPVYSSGTPPLITGAAVALLQDSYKIRTIEDVLRASDDENSIDTKIRI